MKLEVLPDADAAVRRAAVLVAAEARAAVAARGRFTLALSGGRTPRAMFTALVGEDVPWKSVHLFQVDERVAPAGDPDRSWSGIEEALLARVALPATGRHPMPVEAPDLEAAAAGYAEALRAVAGDPPVLDLVHLGLGEDGHTASLFPGDPVLDVEDADVAVTAEHGGRRRMTLTWPALDRAIGRLWLVTGAEKAAMLPRLRRGDPEIPAGRIRRTATLCVADRAAASGE